MRHKYTSREKLMEKINSGKPESMVSLRITEQSMNWTNECTK